MKLHLDNRRPDLDPFRAHHEGTDKHYHCLMCGAEFDLKFKPRRCPECKCGKLEEVKK